MFYKACFFFFCGFYLRHVVHVTTGSRKKKKTLKKCKYVYGCCRLRLRFVNDMWHADIHAATFRLYEPTTLSTVQCCNIVAWGFSFLNMGSIYSYKRFACIMQSCPCIFRAAILFIARNKMYIAWFLFVSSYVLLFYIALAPPTNCNATPPVWFQYWS